MSIIKFFIYIVQRGQRHNAVKILYNFVMIPGYDSDISLDTSIDTIY